MLTSLLALVPLLGALLPQTPEHPAPPPLVQTITGQCRGHDAAAKQPVRLSLWLHDYDKEAATLVRDLHAASDGSFTIADVPWLTAFEWGSAFYVLEARQGERVGMQLLRGEGAASSPLDVELGPGLTVKGSVRSITGEAIAGADVRLRGLVRGESWLFFAETPPPWNVRTATDGSFVIRGVPPGYRCTIMAVAEGRAQGRIDADAAEPFAFELDAGAVLAGRVVDEHGTPMVRVRVCTQGVHHSFWTTTRTDDRGEYVLSGLSDDVYNVWAETDDMACTALDSQPITLGERTAAPDLVMTAGGFFVGRVVDAEGQAVQPGPTADVAIYGPSRPRSGAACHISHIRADGTFRIRVAPGSNYIYLRAGDGYEGMAPSSYTMDVAAGEEQTIEFRVVRTKATPGRGPR